MDPDPGPVFSAVVAAQPPTNAQAQTWARNLRMDRNSGGCDANELRRRGGARRPGRIMPGQACGRQASASFCLGMGKSLRFDEGGNAKAVDALRKSRKGSKSVFDYWKTGKTSNVVKARVTGTLTSDTLNVETIKID